MLFHKKCFRLGKWHVLGKKEDPAPISDIQAIETEAEHCTAKEVAREGTIDMAQKSARVPIQASSQITQNLSS